MAARAPSPHAPRVLHVDSLGYGTPVVIVHGVGLGPWSVVPVSQHVAKGARALIVHRAGYGRSRTAPAARTMDEHVADLLRALDRQEISRPVMCGFAGGATIALALALAHPRRVAALVLHEPALGPLAPGVHALVCGLADRVVGRSGPEALGEVMTVMLGEDASIATPAASMEDAHAIPVEVPAFAAFAPAADDLRELRALPITTTVGERSPSARHAAAGVLADLAGARIAVVPESAHVAQLDAPHALAAEALRLAAPE